MGPSLLYSPSYGDEMQQSCDAQASMASDSGSLHSLPAYSYLAKPFEPPGGQALGRSKPVLQPCASKDALSEGGSGPQTPSNADLLAPEGPAMPLSGSTPAGIGFSQRFSSLACGMLPCSRSQALT